MLFGAWSVSSNKHVNLMNPSEKNGKFRFLLLCGSFCIFLIVGAAIFAVIEAPKAEKYQKSILNAKEAFLKANPCLLGKFNFFLCLPFL